MISLRPVDHETHRSTVQRWLASNHVTRWWGEPSDRLAQFDATPAANHVIILHRDCPIGYARWEAVDLVALAAFGLGDIPASSIDLDIFIGDKDFIGKGAGPAALCQIFDFLAATTDAPMVGLCTSTENTNAHRAFEKAGCLRLKRFDDDRFGPCWVYARYLVQHDGNAETKP